MDYLKDIIRKHGKFINLYIGKESTINQLSGDVEITYGSPNPVKGMLEDLSDASAIWKIPGKSVSKAKIFVCHKNYKNLFLASHKIEIDNETYYGWKDGAGSNLRIKEEDNYLRVYLIRKLF